MRAPLLPRLRRGELDLVDPGTILCNVEEPPEPQQQIVAVSDGSSGADDFECAAQRLRSPGRGDAVVVGDELVESGEVRRQRLCLPSDRDSRALVWGRANRHGDALEAVDTVAGDVHEQDEGPGRVGEPGAEVRRAVRVENEVPK